MTELNGFFQQVYGGNSLLHWLIAVGIFLILFLVLWVIKKVAVSRLKHFARKTRNRLDDYLSHTLAATRLWFLFGISLYAGSQWLKLSADNDKYLSIFAVTVFLLQAAVWANQLVTRYLRYYRRTRLEEDAASVTTVAVLGFITRLGIYSLTLLLILDNAGINVTALIAGLGVGGIAIALAAQNVLGDLFASVAIAFDKPFALGDFIIVDDIKGTVENIGMKTTRIRSLDGEQIAYPNSDLIKGKIRNYKRMEERRILFSLGVIYQTSLDQLQKIPEIIKGTIEQQEKTRFDRAHFKEYGDFSLNYEIVYYVLSPDYNEYMNIQHRINLAIFAEFAKEGIEFAYPTQTLFVEQAQANSSQ